MTARARAESSATDALLSARIGASRTPRLGRALGALRRPATATLFLLLMVASLGPLVLGEAPFRVDLGAILESPSAMHPLGTDETGRDALARLLYGARLTLGIGLGGAALALLLGTALGGLAGYRGGAIDALVMRFVDFSLAFPSLFAILLFSALFSTGLVQLIFLIGLTGWMTVARLARGAFREIMVLPYVEAARACGAGGTRIVTRHLVPNALSVLFVAAVAQVNRAILAEATISFLGMGVKPPTPTWGNLLISAQDYLWTAPWLAVAPGVALTVTMLAIFLLGDRANAKT